MHNFPVDDFLWISNIHVAWMMHTSTIHIIQELQKKIASVKPVKHAFPTTNCVEQNLAHAYFVLQDQLKMTPMVVMVPSFTKVYLMQ